jgi:hypothetical protein
MTADRTSLRDTLVPRGPCRRQHRTVPHSRKRPRCDADAAAGSVAHAKAGAGVYVAEGPNDIATPAGVRKPDAFIVPRDVSRTAISGKVRTYYASDLLLVAEVISPRSGSEQVDRVRKVREYARAGIPAYWIIDLEPEPKVTILTLHGSDYVLDSETRAGHVLTVSQPYPISFDPAELTELN